MLNRSCPMVTTLFSTGSRNLPSQYTILNGWTWGSDSIWTTRIGTDNVYPALSAREVETPRKSSSPYINTHDIDDVIIFNPNRRSSSVASGRPEPTDHVHNALFVLTSGCARIVIEVKSRCVRVARPIIALKKIVQHCKIPNTSSVKSSPLRLLERVICD